MPTSPPPDSSTSPTQPAWLRFGIAGWPALAFLGGTLLAHSHTTEEPEPDPVPSAPAAPDPVTAVERESPPDPAPEPEPLAAAAKDIPELALAPVAPAGPSVPAALVDHARKLADDHHARTGARIDTDTLRARLGVPPQLAETIAAQLA